MSLPKWNNKPENPLAKFIHKYEPAGDDYIEWRERLSAAINHAIAQQTHWIPCDKLTAEMCPCVALVKSTYLISSTETVVQWEYMIVKEVGAYGSLVGGCDEDYPHEAGDIRFYRPLGELPEALS